MKLMPVVNMDVSMPKQMFLRLCRYETICAVTQKNIVDKDDVLLFLGPLLAQDFKPEFLSLVAQ